MATLTPQGVVLPSLLPLFTAAAGGGDKVAQANDLILAVNNGSGASINLTIDVPGTDDFGNANPDLVVAIAAGTQRWIPIQNARFTQSDGSVQWTYSSVTTVTVGAFLV